MSPTPPEANQSDETTVAVAAVALRLLAGAVPRRTMEQLQRTVQQSPAEYPWEVVTRSILAEPVDPEQLLRQGLQAQRDWIQRGGRETPSRPVAVRAKGVLARLLAQLLFLLLCSLVLVVALLLLKHKLGWFDIYSLLEAIYDWFPSAKPAWRR